MADVRREQRGNDRCDRDRGQLVLVTGLAVAVTLVALVLLLNTAIYTQNLATRGGDVQDDEAVGFRTEAVTGVEGVVETENRAERETQAEIESNVTDGISRFDRLLSQFYAERGTIADVEEESLVLTEGALLRQANASRNFTSRGDGSSDWTLVEKAGAGSGPGVRNATFTVSRENLSDTATASFSVRLLSYTDADSDGSDDEWRVYVYDESGAVTLAVKNGTESVTYDVCSAVGPEATVDLTAGTINGTPCPALDWANGISAPYDVVFRNAKQVEGTYSMTVDTSAIDTDVKEGNFANADSGASPRAVPAVYAAEVELHFETPDVTFHTTIRAARGEPE